MWGKEALVEPKVPNGSFETFKRDMTGQLGVEPSSLEGQRKWGKALEGFRRWGKEALVESSSLEGFRWWGHSCPPQLAPGEPKCKTAVSKPLKET